MNDLCLPFCWIGPIWIFPFPARYSECQTATLYCKHRLCLCTCTTPYPSGNRKTNVKQKRESKFSDPSKTTNSIGAMSTSIATSRDYLKVRHIRVRGSEKAVAFVLDRRKLACHPTRKKRSGSTDAPFASGHGHGGGEILFCGVPTNHTYRL